MYRVFIFIPHIVLQSTHSFAGLYNSIAREKGILKRRSLSVRVSWQRRGRRWVEEKKGQFTVQHQRSLLKQSKCEKEREKEGMCFTQRDFNDETLSVTSCVAGGHEFEGKEEWQEKTCVSLSLSLLSIHFMTRNRCITPSFSLFSSPERLSSRTRESYPLRLESFAWKFTR